MSTRLANSCACCLTTTANIQPCLLHHGGRSCYGEPGLCACAEGVCEAEEVNTPTCADLQTLSTVCGESKVQMVSYLALEQTHLLIFVVALTHVACSVFMYLVARGRIYIWRRAAARRDRHSEHVESYIMQYMQRVRAGVGAGKHLSLIHI